MRNLMNSQIPVILFCPSSTSKQNVFSLLSILAKKEHINERSIQSVNKKNEPTNDAALQFC